MTVHIKQVCTPAGKVKFQAQVWFKGTFYASKTFDSRPLATSYKERALREIVEGKLMPAAARKAQRFADLNLNRSMVDWAADYVVAHADKHCKTRLADYLLVGKLLADKSLEDFNGKNGARYIEQLMTEWRYGRQLRSNKPRSADAPPPKPLSDNTVRLRLTALTRLIRFAGSRLPDKAAFTTPDLDALFEFSLPPAHANPRQRVPTEHELIRLVEHLGAGNPFSEFLEVIYETGCRLSEVRLAQGRDVDFFFESGQLEGGKLALGKHKTSKKVGARVVPLSRRAAHVLRERKLKSGDDVLFPELASNDSVCKLCCKACKTRCWKDRPPCVAW